METKYNFLYSARKLKEEKIVLTKIAQDTYGRLCPVVMFLPVLPRFSEYLRWKGKKIPVSLSVNTTVIS